jgi:polysaccharide biosynthesis protein PslF
MTCCSIGSLLTLTSGVRLRRFRGGPPVHDGRVSYGFLSSAPPTRCGLATFTSALGSTLESLGADVSLVRVLDTRGERSTSTLRSIGELVASDPYSIERATTALNSCDVAVIQHEYGLYGGRDGDDVVTIIDGLFVPSVAILHTVLQRPTPHQVQVLNAVIAGVDVAVVMTHGAAATLERLHELGDTPVQVIPHGAASSTYARTKRDGARPRILTWGLLGPGKGIEWVIDAMVGLKDLTPTPEYIVAGQTHPKVLANDGDGYRQSLMRRAEANGVATMVHFDNAYRDLDSLNRLISSADVVVLPYDSKDQATSGVLVDAVAAGRPVVATNFPHAVELLATGAGITVPHRDPAALCDALRRVISDPTVASTMAAEAHALGAGLSWEAVAYQFQGLTQQLVERANARV